MKIVLRILLVVVLSPLVTPAEELTAEKKAAIKDLVISSGGTKIGVMISDYLIKELLATMVVNDSALTSEVREVIAEEISAIIQKEMGDDGSYWNMILPIYHKYFTLEEVEQIRAFYETPVGQKTIAAMPTMMQETLVAAKEWGESLKATMGERIKERLAKEGASGTGE